MNIADLLTALSAIRNCANLMLENASYIQGELPNVEMNGTLRSQTVEICGSMVGTKHDVVSELFEIDELLESKTDWGTISSRLDRVMSWLWQDISKTHQLVMALREDSENNKNHTLSLILVQESATNILNAFNRAKAAVDALATDGK